MANSEKLTKTVITDEIRRSSQPWLELDPARDTAGLDPGEDTLFESLDEKREYYRQQLYGPRFSTAMFLKPEVEFHQMTYVKARVPAGGRLLLLGEALEPTGLVAIARDTLPGDVETVAHELRPTIKAHGGESRHWSLYREAALDYRDHEFDAVVASQMHHCDDYVPEFQALTRLIKPGGRLVLVDYGPTPMTFELARQDPILEYLLKMFVTWAGARRVPVERAFEHQKKNWLSAPVQNILDAAHEVLDGARLWECKGMAIVDGVCRKS